MRAVTVALCGLCGVAAVSLRPVAAEDLRFLDIPRIQFEAPPAPASPEELPRQPAPPPPLWTKETVAKDTPPHLLALAQNPTLEQARAYVDWQEQKMVRLNAIGLLIQQVYTERRKR